MTTVSYVTQQLPYLVPMLLVYWVGVALSLVNLKRHAKPAAFALMGCGVLFLITAVFPIVQGYFVSRPDHGWSVDQMLRWLHIVGIINTLLHVAAFSLLLVSVFSGRRSSAATEGLMDVGPSDCASESGRLPHRATFVLILGILSLLICAPLGIAVWVMSGSDLAAMRAGRMDRSGESLTNVAQVLGIIGTGLFGLCIAGVVFWFVAIEVMLQGVR